jgi:hypothetical protein
MCITKAYTSHWSVSVGHDWLPDVYFPRVIADVVISAADRAGHQDNLVKRAPSRASGSAPRTGGGVLLGKGLLSERVIGSPDQRLALRLGLADLPGQHGAGVA